MPVAPGRSLPRLVRLRPWHAVLLMVLGLVLYLPGLAALAPMDRDEARYAQATRQMLESGDYIDIRFQDEARYKKPVGIYWLQSISAGWLAGPDHDRIWAYRVPSLLAAIGALLLTAWVGNRLFGATAGALAALMLGCSLLLGVEARTAKTDAALLATVVAAQGVLARLYLDRLKPLPPPFWQVALFWLAQGIGILIKGPFTPLVSGLTVLALWAVDRRIRWARRLQPLVGVAIALVVVVPWLIAIGIASHGEFFSYAIGHELLGKVGQGQESHGGLPGYYLATFWLAFWPFCLPAALAIPWVWRHRHDAEVRFCLAWIVPTWVMFELVVTKLPHYVLPVLPAVALLAARATLERAEAPRDGRRGIGTIAVAALFVLLPTLAIAAAPVLAPWQAAHSLSVAGIAAAIFLLVAGLLIAAAELLLLPRLLLAGAAAAIVGWALVFAWALPGIEAAWLSPRIVAAARPLVSCSKPAIAAAGYTEPSLVFAAGTDTALGGGALVASRMAENPECTVGVVTDGAEAEAFLAEAARQNFVPVRATELTGFNYSRGQRVTIGLYRPQSVPERPAAPEPAP